MRRHPRLAAALITAIALAAVATSLPVAADPIKMAVNIWVGFGPLYIARDKGFFQRRGLDVELIVMENVTEKYTAFAAARIDMAAGGTGTSLLFLSEPNSVAFALESQGSHVTAASTSPWYALAIGERTRISA
jgi:NitT/TauT family transport system substrate-binding protein